MKRFILFGPGHLAWILAIAISAACLASLCRHNRIPHRPLRIVLAWALAGCQVARYLQDGLAWPHRLPLQLCDVTAWVAVAACLTTAHLAAEYVYFTGLAGAAMAVLTPDMGAQWPARFFLTHGVLIVSACVLTFGRLVPLRRGAMWRAYGLFLGGAAATGVFDWALGTNYLYLCYKPASVTFYNWMGPWPVYPVSAALLALVLFRVLWLPWRSTASADALGASQSGGSLKPDGCYSPRSTSSGLRRSQP